MRLPLLLTSAALCLAACSGRPPADGAIRLSVTYSGFRPACVTVVAQDAEAASNAQTVRLPVADASVQELSVAIFRPSGWSASIQLSAQGHERDCEGTAVAVRTSEVLRFSPGTILPTALALSAPDGDQDGYVPRAAGGSDCDDARAAVHPGIPEACNGQDDDCDDVVDEGCECVGGDARSCYSGPAPTQGVGLCTAGTQRCTGGAWGPCEGQILPATERCNDGADEDCDGEIDEGCPCVSGTAQNCYGGPGGTSGVGLCKSGQQSCVDGGWAKCMGEVLPAPELCDTKDNDCNGSADDSVPPLPCYTFDAGSPDAGACRGGARSCSGGLFGACVGQVGPAAETCDGVDNDCDGTVDGFSQACFPFDAGTPGVGLCKAGTRQCTGGAFSPCSGQVGPARELCDNQDNDCNSATDEGLGKGGACTVMPGCAASFACEVDGGLRCVQTGTPVSWFFDDDEDGRGNPDSGVLGCVSPGLRYVTNATDCDDGDPATFVGATEVCDQKDNNCDGVTNDQMGGGSCPNGSLWTPRGDTTNNVDWLSVTSPAVNDVLVVGAQNRIGFRYMGPGFVIAGSPACSDGGTINFTVAESLVGTNQYFLGGENGELSAGVVAGAGSCTPSAMAAPGKVVGLAAFNAGGVVVMGASAGGQTFRFRPPNTVEALPSLPNVTLTSLAAVSPTDVLVVGRLAVPPFSPYAARFNGTAWVDQTPLFPAGLPNVSLRDVSMVSARLAFAVGDSGLVLKLRDGVWSVMTPPSPPPNFSSVLAFGANALYTTDPGGVRRHTLAGWTLLAGPFGGGTVPLDVAGTAPTDLWVSGTKGLVLHWHE